MKLIGLDNLVENSRDAVNHIDDVKAKKLLKEIDAFVVSQNINITNPGLFEKIKRLVVQLKIVALSQISDEETEDILRNHYLDSFNIEVPMENRLIAKLFYIPEIPRDELRKRLKKAILENNQKLGNLTIGQWLREFEKMFDVKTRDRSAPVRFVMEHPQAQTLSETDKAKLKEIIHTYDYLLVSTLPTTGPVLNKILESSVPIQKREEGYPQSLVAPVRTGEKSMNWPRFEYDMQRSVSGERKQLAEKSASPEKLSIGDALQKYPRLGEQLVTANPIKLKILPGSLRPSIKNWITDYHQALGAVSHGTIERGNYLYHSENAKRLTAGERQKLAIVLKSLDENTPLKIDPEKQEVIFESGIRNQESEKKDSRFGFLRKREIPESQFTVTKQISDSMPPVRDEAGIINKESQRNQESGKIYFSSPQKFSRPAPPPPPVPPKLAPTSKPEHLPPRPSRSRPAPEEYEHYRPYKITHLSHEEPEKEKKPEPRINGNVVDLRSQQ